ncbi:hypothetical protein LINPERHAP2_LOCUS45465 [Linum perenne]
MWRCSATAESRHREGFRILMRIQDVNFSAVQDMFQRLIPDTVSSFGTVWG